MVGGIVAGMISAVMGVIAIVVIQSIIGSMDTTEWNAGVKGIVELLPIVMAATVVLGVFGAIAGGPVVATYVRYRKWEEFGIRLKIAYEAKFGYSNPSFCEEVDQLVLSLRSHSKGAGSMKGRSEERLKRLARLVEVKFVIPEEDRLSETEKTELLAQSHERIHKEFGVRSPETFREKLQTKLEEDSDFMPFLSFAALTAMQTATKPEERAVAFRIEEVTEPKPSYKPDAGYEEEIYTPKPKMEPIIFIEPEKVAVMAVRKAPVKVLAATKK